MALATLEQLKAQVRADFDDEDDLLQHYLNAAEEYVRGFVPDIGDTDSPPQPVPDTINQATLLIAAAWFDNRETIVGTSTMRERPQEIPYGAQDILRNLRSWTFG
jgi:uncharacterized phage protein (predicted DNA packaging)